MSNAIRPTLVPSDLTMHHDVVAALLRDPAPRIDAVCAAIGKLQNNDLNAGLDACTRVAQHPALAEPVAQCWLLSQRGTILRRLNRAAEAEDCISRSTDAARALGDADLLATCLVRMTDMVQQRGDYSDAARLCGEALQVQLKRGNVVGVMRMFGLAGVIANSLGWHARVFEMFRLASLAAHHAPAERIAAVLDMRFNRALATLNWVLDETQLQRRQSALGALVVAARHLAEARQLAETLDARNINGELDHLAAVLAWLKVHLGHSDAEAGLTAAERALLIDDEQPVAPQFNMGYRLLARGMWCLRLGQRERAGQLLQMALDNAVDIEPAPVILICRTLAKLHADNGEGYIAYQLQQRAERVRQQQCSELAGQRLSDLLGSMQREASRSVGFLGHDLRSPLSAVLALARDATEHRPQDAVAALARVAQLTQRALDYTDDFLIYTHLHALDATQFEDVLVTELISDVVDEVQAAHRGRGSRLTEQVSDGLLVHAHYPTLRRVLVNLLNNAMQHTPPGTAIELRAESDGTDLVITVRDNGPGLPMPQQLILLEHVMGPERAAASGLGLRFVARAVRALHGVVFAVNRGADGPDCGTTITVALPLRRDSVPLAHLGGDAEG